MEMEMERKMKRKMKWEWKWEGVEEFMCPISRDMIEMAVVAQDGFTYDKTSIQQWLGKSSRSPLLGTELGSNKLIPNRALNYLIASSHYYRTQVTHLKSMYKRHRTFEVDRMQEGLRTKLQKVLQDYFRLSRPLTALYAELDQLLQEFPKSFHVLVEYANMLRFGGETERSLKFLQAAEEVCPHSPIPKYMATRMCVGPNKDCEARKLFDKLHSTHSILDHTLLDVRYLTGACFSNRSKVRALEFISGYLLVYPQDKRARLNQVYLYYSLSDIDNVLSSSAAFLAQYQYDACVMYYRARAIGIKGNSEEAFANLRQIIENSKEPLFVAQCLYDRAQMRNAEKDFEAVVQDLELAHRIYPKINADLLLAESHRTRQQFPVALQWLRTYGSRIDPLHDIFYQRLNADICENMNKTDEAVASYLKLVELDGINSTYYTQRLHTLLDTEHEELANLLDISLSEDSGPDG